jgi:C-terminal processing protease CtpA/Prc
LKIEAFAQLSNNAQTIADTYPGILKALELLEDNHSFYITPTGSYIRPNGIVCEGSSFSIPDLPSHIGYIKVSNFAGSATGTDGVAFAENIQTQIRNLDHPDITAWIVDLRANAGGNMWPMIAGVGPILGEGIAGYFVYPDELEQPWGFQEGGSQLDGQIVTPIANSYTLINPNPKVAVLLDNGVASSGEATAVSFIGRPNTQTFGTSTCGLSTANQPFYLSDNATLQLTTSYFADRNLNVYGDQIQPEQPSSPENVMNDAINWIEN